MLRARIWARSEHLPSAVSGAASVASLSFVVALAIVVAGCGKHGQGAATDSEKAADVEVLNAVLAQELTTVAAYGAALALLRGPPRGRGRSCAARTRPTLDAITKAIRGVGGETDAEAAELEPPGPEERGEALAARLRRGERLARRGPGRGATICTTAAPRTLAAALAASHAQHLVVLRQVLGAGLAASVPEAFETGDVPPPAAACREADDAARDRAPLRDRPLLLAPPLADDRGLGRRSPSASSSPARRAKARPTTTSPCPAPARPSATELLEDNLPEQAFGSNPLVFQAKAGRSLTEPEVRDRGRRIGQAAERDARRQLGGQPAQPGGRRLPQQGPLGRLRAGRPRRRPERTDRSAGAGRPRRRQAGARRPGSRSRSAPTSASSSPSPTPAPATRSASPRRS